jgi:hypothetical protein
MASKLEQSEKELTSTIVKRIRMGCPPSTAAACAGITVTTFNNYLRKGANGRQPFKRFSNAVNKALAELEGHAAAAYARAALEDPKFARSFLIDRFPERWGPQDADAVKDINRLLAVMAGVLKPKDFKTVLELWDHRKTIGDD